MCRSRPLHNNEKGLTTLSDGRGGGQVPVLAVHVVNATARRVTQPDTKVLDPSRSFLIHLQISRREMVTTRQ